MPSFEYDILIRNIKVAMKASGIKQKCIAENAGFSEQDFSNMMTKRKMIRAEYIPAIAHALGVTANDLFLISKDTA